MRILQVKKYHTQIAQRKEKEAIERWKTKDNGYGYPVRTMFFFYKYDSNGYPTEERKNGYVAFNNIKSVYGKNREEAIRKYFGIVDDEE